MYTGLKGEMRIKNPNDVFGQYMRVAYISGWSIEDKTETIETTRIDSIFKERITGYQSWSASADGTVTFKGNSGYGDLLTAKKSGKKIELKFYLENSGNDESSTFFQGEGYIESLSIDLSAGDKGNISLRIAGTGPLDLYSDGINVKTKEPVFSVLFKMEIDEEGHLFATIPDDAQYDFFIDDRGHLILKA